MRNLRDEGGGGGAEAKVATQEKIWRENITAVTLQSKNGCRILQFRDRAAEKFAS